MAVVCVASQYSGINDTRGKQLATSRKNKDIHQLIVKGFLAFENWPHNFYEFLDWKRKQEENRKYYSSITDDFGGFIPILRRSLPSKSFDFMRLAFEEYLKSRWDGGLLFKKTLRLTKDSYAERKYLSQEEVARRLHIASSGIGSLVNAGLLRAILIKEGKNKQYLFDREEVEELGQQIGQLLTAKEIGELLGIGRLQAKDLVRKKCIKIFNKSLDIGFRYWRFAANEASNLISAIDAKIIKEPASSRGNLIGFNKAVLRICPSGIDIGDFVKAILDGEIRPRGKTKNKGLNQFLFSGIDLRDLSDRYRNNLKGMGITIPEAARFLGINMVAVYFFITKGLISTYQISRSSLGIMTTEESLNLFNSTYALAIKVAREVGTSTTLLYSCLNAVGVKPISGLKIDGGKQYLYRKADLQGLNLASLVLKEKLKRDPRGKLHITIGAEQACAFLGVNNTKLVELVNTNQLRPHMEVSDKKEGPSEYIFLRTEVEKYRDKNVDFSELVSSQEAAELLSESRSSFCNKWVRTKRLRPLNLKHIHYKHYFLRREIEELVIFQKETIRSREAAQLLKVGGVTLFKWTRAGKVQPVSGPHIDGFGCNMYLREDIEKLRRERNKKSNKDLRRAC